MNKVARASIESASNGYIVRWTGTDAKRKVNVFQSFDYMVDWLGENILQPDDLLRPSEIKPKPKRAPSTETDGLFRRPR